MTDLSLTSIRREGNTGERANLLENPASKSGGVSSRHAASLHQRVSRIEGQRGSDSDPCNRLLRERIGTSSGDATQLAGEGRAIMALLADV